MFKPIQPHPNFPQLEEEILEFWRKNKIFEKSLEKNNPPVGGKKFVFYEGPPTANGRPGVHHVLARVYKDLFCRYKTMRGFYVRRRAGWDTHGLPVEIEVEKKLGLKNKKEIENYGIAKFNKECRESVFKYKTEWENLTERIGFWLDMKNPYVTYENSYIEKVWGVLKEIWDKNLIYKGFKVVPYCPRCGTTLSSHEVAQGYKNIEEETIYIKFKVQNPKSKINEKKFFLVWTTTPWTLPANVALAVNENLDYAEVEIDGETLILAKNIAEKLFGKDKIKKVFPGKELVGQKYQPLYDDYSSSERSESRSLSDDSSRQARTISNDNDFQVYPADFVSSEEGPSHRAEAGTGIVHIAPAFGEDDMNLQNKFNLSVPIPVDEQGKMLSEIANRKFIKDADPIIKQDLTDRGLLYKEENITHDYPFCWRCDTPLIYFAKSSWFLAMSKLQDELIKNNSQANWIPPYIKNGRFGQWLREVKDWALSRERFWGSPLPFWVCQKCQKIKVIGSIEEMQKLSVKPIDIKTLDLHKPYIDEVAIKCSECDGEMHRVSEVLDVWFDAGAMPFASGEFPDFFPADYISEGIDQTRGWFYTLLAISTALKKGPSYKNVISLGLVLDENGKKMSKSRGNIIEPETIINKFGTDALRWYFFSVNNPGDPKRLGEKNIQETLQKFILILWNVYSFFITYANIDEWQTEKHRESTDVMDRWIKSRLNVLTRDTAVNLDKFEAVQSARSIGEFVNDLSTWYLRRSRKRRNGEFYSTLYEVLKNLTIIIAPFVPFTAEMIYLNLKQKDDPESIHLSEWPASGEIDESLSKDMQKVRQLAEIAHAQRAASNIPLRQPLSSATISQKFSDELLEILKDEINVKEIKIEPKVKDIEIDTKITDELRQEGILRELLRIIQGLRKKEGLNPGQKVNLSIFAEGEMVVIIKTNKEKIQKETVTQISFVDKSEERHEHQIGDKKIYLKLVKDEI